MAKKCCFKIKNKIFLNKIPILNYIKDIKELAVELKYTYLKDKSSFFLSGSSQVGVFTNMQVQTLTSI